MKSTVQQIRARFDGDVDRFSDLETGQSATLDAPLVLEFEAPIRDDGSQWQFALWRPTDRHQGAIAVRRGAGRDRRIVFRRGLGDVFQTPVSGTPYDRGSRNFS